MGRDAVKLSDPMAPLRPTVLAPVFGAFPQVLAAWQYGSSLRSDYRPGDSDIDILLIVADDTTFDAYVDMTAEVRGRIPGAEVTVLRHEEVLAGIHPGGSRHYFVNVSRSGHRLHGSDLLSAVAARQLTLEDAYRRVVELTQRSRLVCLNSSKAGESAFWLNKYQHWIPLCLMELLDLAGAPEDHLQVAHARFLSRFPALDTGLTFPYQDLVQLVRFLERLIRWIPENAESFQNQSGRR